MSIQSVRVEIVDKDKNQLGENELIHREFTKVVNTFLKNGANSPILIQGPKFSGKKTITNQLGELIGKEPRRYNFGKTTINNEMYFGPDALAKDLASSCAKGKFIVIEALDEMQMYDYIVLMGVIKTAYRSTGINPDFRMIILEDSNYASLRTLSDSIKKECVPVRVEKDPAIETKRLQEIALKKAREKALKERK